MPKICAFARIAAIARARASTSFSSSASVSELCHTRGSAGDSRKTRSSTKAVCTHGCCRAPHEHECTLPMFTRCFRSLPSALSTNDVGPGSCTTYSPGADASSRRARNSAVGLATYEVARDAEESGAIGRRLGVAALERCGAPTTTRQAEKR